MGRAASGRIVAPGRSARCDIESPSSKWVERVPWIRYLNRHDVIKWVWLKVWSSICTTVQHSHEKEGIWWFSSRFEHRLDTNPFQDLWNTMKYHELPCNTTTRPPTMKNSNAKTKVFRGVFAQANLANGYSTRKRPKCVFIWHRAHDTVWHVLLHVLASVEVCRFEQSMRILDLLK